MGLRENLSNFDLGRLTFLGRLIFLLSLAVGIGAAILVGTYWDEMFPPQPGNKPRRVGPAGIAGFAGAIGFFFAVKLLLQVLGVQIVRPAIVLSEMTRGEQIAYHRRSVSQARRGRLIFLLMMPLGFLVPAGIAVALVMASDPPPAAPEGITLPQLFGMLALGLPIIALGGWLLKRGDVQKHTDALALLEQPKAVRKRDMKKELP
jgi:hypothetical protein